MRANRGEAASGDVLSARLTGMPETAPSWSGLGVDRDASTALHRPSDDAASFSMTEG